MGQSTVDFALFGFEIITLRKTKLELYTLDHRNTAVQKLTAAFLILLWPSND